jgi:4-amino-4-deoxy-L-arabinose transferase-like glycosyltransferase
MEYTNGHLKIEAIPLMVLAAFWLAAILIVNPVGDFPLNDDFSYGRSVLNLVSEGKLLYDQWLSMTLLSQVLWGTVFCEIFGFSFTVLRFSTLVLGWIGLAACYFLCRDLGQNRRFALMVALLVAFNPFFFSLSFTFMTDVPFFTFSVLATLFYGKAFRSGASKWLVAGTFFAIAATFVRQLGLMLPLAFGLAWLVRGKFRLRAWPAAAVPAVLALALFFWFSNWLAASQGLPGGYGNFQKLFQRMGDGGFLEVAICRTGILATYLGVFLLPVCLLLLPVPGRVFDKKNWLPALVLLMATGAFATAWDKLPWGNLLYNFGLGPKLLKDGYFNLNIRPVLPVWILNLLKITGLASMLLFVFLKIKQLPAKIFRRNASRPFAVFALVNLALYAGFLMLDKHFFDRYFFQMLPFLLILVLPPAGIFLKKWLFRVSILLIILQAVFSITTTHDYLSWSRARWQALDFLTEEKNIPPNRIDGGFEFNGWHKPGPRDNGPWKSWWWVDRDDYVIAFGGLPNFTKEKGFPFVRWLPPGVDSVFVLRHD